MPLESHGRRPQGAQGLHRRAGSCAPSKLPRNEAFAYWANLYNAITLQVILDRFPVHSIRDIKSDGLFDPKAYIGPWRTKRVTVEGKQLSLDDIEHEIMRPTFKDPRVHYSVNCASFGCPNLPAKAWNAATLDADLDAAARDFINHPRGVAVLAGGKLKVSSIYKWFRDDFGADDAAVIAHLKKYAKPELAPARHGDHRRGRLRLVAQRSCSGGETRPSTAGGCFVHSPD